MNELGDLASQHENVLASVTDKLTAEQQNSQQLKFRLDDALRHAADERERLGIQILKSVTVSSSLYYCSCSQYQQPVVLMLSFTLVCFYQYACVSELCCARGRRVAVCMQSAIKLQNIL